jgi:hypothetical protein
VVLDAWASSPATSLHPAATSPNALGDTSPVAGTKRGWGAGPFDGGVEGDRVWTTCTCRAVINRNVDGD